MNRALPTALLALSALLATASAAGAATFRAELGGSGTACTPAAPCAKIFEARDAARATPGPDTIEIGPGVWGSASSCSAPRTRATSSRAPARVLTRPPTRSSGSTAPTSRSARRTSRARA